jgi:uncharacterized protein YgbK (DUF1537 family)
VSPAFDLMSAYRAPVILYKVCSTFDSSPFVGNIGRVIEIGRRTFDSEVIPILPAAPRMGRYTVFGQQFASLGEGEIYRLDRHPSMMDHPVTPMREADLRLHLAQQTTLASRLIDVLALDKGDEHVAALLDIAVAEGTPIVFFDCLYPRHLQLACEVLWRRADPNRPVFLVGSHELGQGFAGSWAMANLLPLRPAGDLGRQRSSPGPLLVISGSCATVTGEQVRWAVGHGFVNIEIEAQHLLQPGQQAAEHRRVIGAALDALGRGLSVVAHTCLGPDDPRVHRMKRQANGLSLSYQAANDVLGNELGKMAREIIKHSRLKRLVVAGGDTSGRVQAHLDLQALQVAKSFGNAGPLCYVYSTVPEINGLEVAFKGGQVGGVDYFDRVKAATTSNFAAAALGHL